MKLADTKTNAMTQELDSIIASDETKTSLKESFLPFFTQAEDWAEKSKKLVVTDASQVEEMKQAREARLALKNIRTSVENKRKELKEESLKKGRAIDGMANVIKFLISPIENHLKEQEDFIKIQEEKRKSELLEVRSNELLEYGVDTTFYNLSEMPDESYSQLLENSIALFNQKKEQEKIEQEAAIAKEKEELENRRKIEEENRRLKIEAEKRESAIKIEQEKRRKEAAKIAEIEKKKRLEQEDRLKKEVAEKARLQKIIDDKKKADELVKKQRLAEERRVKDEIEAKEKEARLAPEKIKLQKLAESIVSLDLPDVKSKEAKEILKSVQVLLNKTSNYIKEQIIEL